jgi:hypothetical protein
MDAELETAIDKAGRDRVFARARSLGWSVANTPEKWVWWGIVHELESQGAGWGKNLQPIDSQ